LRRFSKLPRRLLALAGATFVGAVGAVAFAAPASAHYPIVTYKVECGPTPTTAIITWEVGNSEDFDAKLSNVEPSGGIGDIKDNAILAKKSEGTKLTGTQTVNIADGSATLFMHVTWDKGRKGVVERDSTTTADFRGQVCAQVEVDFRSKCDGTVLVKLSNPLDHAVTFTIEGTDGWKKDVEVAAGSDAEETVPAANAAGIRVKVGNKRVGAFRWEKPKDCGVPELTTKSDCKNLTITVTNPEDGRPVRVSIKVGDKEDETEVQPGETAEAVIPGEADLVAIVTIGHKVTEVKYEKPANCETPALPVTGANAGLIAGSALLLVTSGAGLFIVARRRRIRFAA
jgi:hypothetical protein